MPATLAAPSLNGRSHSMGEIWFIESRKRRLEERQMSVEQKSVFLDKFSTRDRRLSGSSFMSSFRSRENGNLRFTSTTDFREMYFFDRKETNSVEKRSSLTLGCAKYVGKILEILFEPYSKFCYFWSMILILAIFYNAWIVIFRTAFPASSNYQTVWFVLDYTFDVIYLFDIFISSRMSFLENGIYVDDIRKVMATYVKSSNFLVDALSLLPLDVLYFFDQVRPVYRLPRLLKVIKVFQAKKVVEAMTNFPNLVRGIFWLHTMFLLMHWNSCIYYMLSWAEGFGANEWVYPRHEGLHKDLSHRYSMSMYWSTLVLTNIGESDKPQTTIECLYMIVCYITGIFIFATIVGQAGNVIQNMNSSRVEFEKQRDKTVQYMKGHNVPQHLRKRVRLWYDYTYSRGRFNGGDDINEVKILPDKMKTELALHVHLETLRKVSFLQKCQPEFLHDLVLKMKLHIFTPGDVIVRNGEIAREMYVVSDGIAEVVSESGRVLKILQPGDFFGEIGLLSLNHGENRRTADVRSCGYIELFVLSKDDVMTSIRDYPQAQRILAKHGRKRLALGSKNTRGPRSETTSSDESEDENEDQLFSAVRKESESQLERKAGAKASPVLDTMLKDLKKCTESPLKKSDTLFPEDCNSFFVDCSSSPPSDSVKHGNVVGPSTSFSNLVLGKQRSGSFRHKSHAKKPSISRSHSDFVPRKGGGMVHLFGSKRSVLSDGEPKHEKPVKRKDSEEMLHDWKETLRLKEDEILESIVEMYKESVELLKQRTRNEIKNFEKRFTEQELNHKEKSHEREQYIQQREEELNRKMKEKEEELQKSLDELKRKQHDFAHKEELMRHELEKLRAELKDSPTYKY